MGTEQGTSGNGPHRFAPGNQAGVGRKTGVLKGRLLRDAEYVADTDEADPEKPDTSQQKALRAEKERAPSKFMDRLVRLQEIHEQKRHGEGKGLELPGAEPETDEGEEKVRELIQGLLREARGEK